MRVILHIGQPKTGTTSLQHTIVGDSDRLSEHGYLFPDTGHQRDPRDGPLLPNHNGIFLSIREPDRPRAWQPLEEIRAQLGAALDRHQPETLLISAETAFTTGDYEARAVLDAFDEMMPATPSVIGYLRRPDHFISSFHRQLLRGGEKGTGLHTPARLQELQQTCFLDYEKALGPFVERYDDIRIFDFEKVESTVDHFYANVLHLAPPDIVPPDTNPSIPLVFGDLVRDYNCAHGRLEPRQIAALLRFGDRERVDLLGRENRRALYEFFLPQNQSLGRFVNRGEFFDDLELMLEPPTGSVDAETANDRYRAAFDALVTPVGLWDLRRTCHLFERRGQHMNADAVFREFGTGLDDDEHDRFREDLEMSSDGQWTIEGNHYARTGGSPPFDPVADLKRLALGARNRLRRVRTRVGR